jgi:hypothetical protein
VVLRAQLVKVAFGGFEHLREHVRRAEVSAEPGSVFERVGQEGHSGRIAAGDAGVDTSAEFHLLNVKQ